jgi:UDP-N-acetylmuramoyl-tripeptide--D-alanyl-D-alanine ligase
MNIWDVRSLRAALDVEIAEGIQTSHIEFNSKQISGGELFVALTGGATDGHLYVKDALNRGASCAIVSKLIEDVDRDKLILVGDTYQALLKLAKYKRDNSQAKFIAVTGSVGKTSTKNAIYMALQACGKSFFTRGNFNNNLGLPINLASMPSDIEFAVIELGMNHRGELSELTQIVLPDIAVITNVEAVHIEYFNSIEDIVDAKCEIFEGLDHTTGVAIINGDSLYLDRMKNDLKQKQIHQILSFSNAGKGNSNLIAVNYQESVMIADYEVMGERIQVKTNIIGNHQALNISIALLVAKTLKQDLNKAALGLSKLEPEKGRGLAIQMTLPDNKKVTVINDAYNASVPSITASLANIKNIPAKRKVAVLADMYELGVHAQTLHENLAAPIQANNIDLTVTVGPFMEYLHKKLPQGITKHYANLEQLKLEILSLLEDDDVILFKGSKGTKLHIFVEEFINQNVKQNAL